DRNALALDRRHALRRLVWDLRRHRVGDHLGRADRHGPTDDFLPHGANLRRHLLNAGLPDHRAGRDRYTLLDDGLAHFRYRVRHLLDARLGPVAANSVGHHLDLVLAHHPGRLNRNHAGAHAAFDEGLARAVLTGPDD